MIHFNLRISSLEIVPLHMLGNQSWEFYKERWPDAEFLVRSTGTGVVYAAASTLEEAREAARMIEKVTIR